MNTLKKQKTALEFLFFAFILAFVSGIIILYLQIFDIAVFINIDAWWWAFIHRMSALLVLLFSIPHIYKNRKWFANFFSKKRKSTITIALSVCFFATLLTTILFPFTNKSVLFEIIHCLVGSVAVLFAIIHTVKRF